MSDSSLWAFGLSAIFTLMLTPLVRHLSLRWGRVVSPRPDRWHRQPKPILGGVAMFLSFLGALVITGRNLGEIWGLVAACGLAFLVGLTDDLRELSPQAKLLGQIGAALLLIFLGYTIVGFFPWRLLDVLLTFLWVVGITNAINLLDNMDGLAAGLSLIASGFLNYFFWRNGQHDLLPLSMALSGVSLGFLVFNFPPSSIFMGDSGSLFLGFTLAALAVAKIPQASNVFAVMGVPTLLLLMPIADTLLVTITRVMRDQSPVRGGRDHTSHRLVAFGLSERQALFVMYFFALLSGIASAVLEALDYDLSLVLIPLVIIALSLLVGYLARLQVVPSHDLPKHTPVARIMIDLTYRHRVGEVLLDFFLIGLAYYLAFWTQGGFRVGSANLEVYLQTVPLALIACYLAYFLFGVYRSVWRFVGVQELIRYAQTVVVGVLLTAGATLKFAPGTWSPVVFLLFGTFLFLGLVGSRISFRLLDQFYGRQHPSRAGENVVIYPADDLGELALRWLKANPHLGYQPVGFLGLEDYQRGLQIHGLPVLSGVRDLQAQGDSLRIAGVIVAQRPAMEGPAMQSVLEGCRQAGLWVRALRLELERLV